MQIKRFKNYLLTEGFGAVKRDFVKTKKITASDFSQIKDFLLNLGDKTGKMVEWLALWWVTNRGKIKSIQGLDYKPEWMDFRRFELSMSMSLSAAIFDYLEMKKSGAIKGMMPKDKMPVDLHIWLNKESNKYYSTKKMKIHPSIKKGEDYEEVYDKNGIQVFKIISHEAATSIGKGTKWCITETSPRYWNTYTSGEGMRFYFIRNHRYNSSNELYKLAVTVNKSNKIDSVWDAGDVNRGDKGLPSFWNLPTNIFKWFKDVKGGYDLKELDKDFEAWVKDLTGWYHKDFFKEQLEWAKEHDEYEKFIKEYNNISYHADDENSKKWLKDMKKYLNDPIGFMEEVLSYNFASEYFASMYGYEEFGMNGDLADFYQGHFGDDAADFWSIVEYTITSGDASDINDYKPSSIYDD